MINYVVPFVLSCDVLHMYGVLVRRTEYCRNVISFDQTLGRDMDVQWPDGGRWGTVKGTHSQRRDPACY